MASNIDYPFKEFSFEDDLYALQDVKLSEIMMSYFGNFIKNGYFLKVFNFIFMYMFWTRLDRNQNMERIISY